jgi:hypothetical protein
VLSFSSTCTVFSLDPDSDHVTISSVALTEVEEAPKEAEEETEKSEETTKKTEEATTETSAARKSQSQTTSRKEDAPQSVAKTELHSEDPLKQGEAAQLEAAKELAGGLSGPTAEHGKSAIDIPMGQPESEHTERVKAEPTPAKHEEAKSLATNTAGETLLETHVKADADDSVKEVEAEEGQKS